MGKIDIQGTESSPVYMESASGNSGDWGGLTICGDATTSAGVDARSRGWRLYLWRDQRLLMSSGTH